MTPVMADAAVLLGVLARMPAGAAPILTGDFVVLRRPGWHTVKLGSHVTACRVALLQKKECFRVSCGASL
jgi:hypothetical protein